VRVSDMRDLRFMASIYQRQNRVAELFKLWAEPPESLRKVFKDHETDILILQADIARDCKKWTLLADTCISVIEREMEPTGNITHISSVAWSIWSGFVKAVKEISPLEE
jgi:N-terminal acetyltransferase B complex non-catalytic subunit